MVSDWIMTAADRELNFDQPQRSKDTKSPLHCRRKLPVCDFVHSFFLQNEAKRVQLSTFVQVDRLPASKLSTRGYDRTGRNAAGFGVRSREIRTNISINPHKTAKYTIVEVSVLHQRGYFFDFLHTIPLRNNFRFLQLCNN